MAVINVGAATETEMKEKKARVEDALHATRAAVEEGIVAGGGTALIRAQGRVERPQASTGDEKTGAGIVARAVEAPLRQLAANAGREGALIVEHVKNGKGGEGYNVATDKYEDLIASGVVDPTKVTRTALQNAASISGLLLTTECLITELPEKEASRRRRWSRPRHGRHGRHDVIHVAAVSNRQTHCLSIINQKKPDRATCPAFSNSRFPVRQWSGSERRASGRRRTFR